MISRPDAQRAKKLLMFLAAGLPAFAIAVPVNFALVEWVGIPKGAAYALVLIMQVSMNYFMCRLFVFKEKGTTAWYLEFAAFVSGILMIRLLDWAVYYVLVKYTGMYYLAVQIMNVLVFAVVKFLFSERLMSPGKRSRS